MSSSVSAILNSEFENILSKEINREATLLSLIRKRPERKATVQWTVNVGGAKSQGVSITGNSPSASRDQNVPASLPIHVNSLQSTFTVNEKEIVEAAAQVSEEELRDLVGSYVTSAVEEMQRSLNEYLFIGDGSVETGGIYGLSTAVGTEDYAGISSNRYNLWQCDIIDLGLDNAGNYEARTDFGVLSVNYMFNMETKIRTKGGRYDMILTTPKVLEQYKRLFDKDRNFYHPVGEQRIPLVDLGFGVAGFAGVPIIDDPHCARVRSDAERAAIATAEGVSPSAIPELDEGVIYFLRMSDLVFKSAPVGNTKMIENGVYTQMERLAKAKLYVTDYAVGTIPQLELHSRKNCGRIQNIELETGVTNP